MKAILLTLILGAAPAPQFVPIPAFVPLPKFSALEVSVTVEVAEPAMVWGVVSRRPHPTCANCPDILEYGWIQAELTVDQAARRLEKWRDLPAETVKRLEAIVNAPAVAKALRQEYSIATCGMVCPPHGSILYDVFPDGTKKPAQSGCQGGSCGGFGLRRIFRGRR